MVRVQFPSAFRTRRSTCLVLLRLHRNFTVARLATDIFWDREFLITPLALVKDLRLKKAFDEENQSSLIISFAEPDPARMCMCGSWICFLYFRAVPLDRCRWLEQYCRCCCRSDHSHHFFWKLVWAFLIHFPKPRNENVFSACGFSRRIMNWRE